MSPRVCLSTAPASTEELQRLRVRVPDAADLVEVRLDTLRPAIEGHDVAGLLGGFPVPVLATCRPDSQGGEWPGSEADRIAVLVACIESGAAYVDIELECAAAPELLRGRGRDRIVLSHHWLRCPEEDEIQSVLSRICALSPKVAKLVAPVESVADSLVLQPAAAALRAAGIHTAVFPMGEKTRGARLISAADGDAWIYARAKAEFGTAPGQWSATRLTDQLRIQRWQPEMARYAVIGDPVRQSLSPAIFNAVFAAAARQALYMPLPSDDFRSAMRLAEAADIAGISVTMPFKALALAVATTATPAAQRSGAANTLRPTRGGWEAHNTDGAGVVAALSATAEIGGRNVAVLGAGGAARAAAVALLDAGCAVTLHARDPQRAAAESAETGADVAAIEQYRAGDFDVLVNATPVGMGATADTPIPTTWLEGDELVLDMIYRPEITPLLEAARERGCTAVSGLEMFLAQAALQHQWWLGEMPDGAVMRAAAREQLDAEASAGRGNP